MNIYKLRKIIRDAIEQHHGTDIVYYFYQKALKENPNHKVLNEIMKRFGL